MTKAKKKRARKDKKISLHPLSLEQALGATMQISPEDAKEIRERDRTSRRRS